MIVYGSWSLTLREEKEREREREGERKNRVMKGILGPKRDEVSGGWRKLCNGGFHGSYSLSSVVRMNKD
jgi:hypothetical protein